MVDNLKSSSSLLAYLKALFHMNIFKKVIWPMFK
jgi:hypothetical protein